MLEISNQQMRWKYRIIRQLFPPLKLKEANHKWYNKLYIYSEILIMILLVSWAISKPFYHLAFSNKYEYSNIKIYSDKNFSTQKILNKRFHILKEKLQEHQIFLKELEVDMYIVNSDKMYYLSMFPGTQFNSYMMHSGAYTFNNSIYFRNSDVNNSMNFDKIKEKHSKYFSSLLMHELVHIWQEDKYYSWISIFTKPKWVIEGYAVYVANSPQVDNEKEFLQWVQEIHPNNLQGWDQYIFYGLMVKYAIKEMNKNIDDLHHGNVDYEEVFKSLLLSVGGDKK